MAKKLSDTRLKDGKNNFEYYLDYGRVNSSAQKAAVFLVGAEAVKAYRIKCTPSGSGLSDLKNWLTASGGTWEIGSPQVDNLVFDKNELAPREITRF